MTTLTLFCWELIMRSNFSKFGAASKHVLAMCARHEHATSHHTPAKIDDSLRGLHLQGAICGLFSRVLYFSKMRDQSCYSLAFSE